MDAERTPLTPDQLFARLNALGVAHKTTRHPPAFTVEQANLVWGDIPGLHCKNFFSRTPGASCGWSSLLPRSGSTSRIADKIGSARLSFGSAALLQEVLGIAPGW